MNGERERGAKNPQLIDGGSSITLRDLFAAAALTQLPVLAQMAAVTMEAESLYLFAAQEAYKLADAMLEERRR